MFRLVVVTYMGLKGQVRVTNTCLPGLLVTDRRAERPARVTILIAGKVKQTNTLTEQTIKHQSKSPQKHSIKNTARTKHTGEREFVRSSPLLSISKGTQYFHLTQTFGGIPATTPPLRESSASPNHKGEASRV